MDLKDATLDELLRELSYREFLGIMSVEEVVKMSKTAFSEYAKEVKDLLRGKVLKNETARLQKIAAEAIIRTTKNEQEIAWHRGGLHYLETLGKRLEFLSSLEKPKED